jgi:hypothetical protein
MFRVENQSDRVWVFGYLRMAPLALFLFGVAAATILPNVGFTSWYLRPAFLVVCVAVSLLLDRSPVLDPVDFIELGIRLRVKRLAGNRVWEIGRIQCIEFKEVASDDYDERRRRDKLVQLTIRLRHAWPSPRLLVSDTAREKIAVWADAQGIAAAGTGRSSASL